MLQVEIFEADSYKELQNKINSWLSDPDNIKVIISHSFLSGMPVAIYHWMRASDYAMIQAQQAGSSKLIRPQ
jgi:hypothetical protein